MRLLLVVPGCGSSSNKAKPDAAIASKTTDGAVREDHTARPAVDQPTVRRRPGRRARRHAVGERRDFAASNGETTGQFPELPDLPMTDRVTSTQVLDGSS
jgi:hypothetical protein